MRFAGTSSDITIGYFDLVASDQRRELGDSSINGCVVTTYGATDRVYEDEGTVTISGTNVGDGHGSVTCSYDDDAPAYRCVLVQVDEETDLVLEPRLDGLDDIVPLGMPGAVLSNYNVVGGTILPATMSTSTARRFRSSPWTTTTAST